MDKYCGCNVVESVVKSGKPPEAKKAKRGYGFFLRLFIAAVAVGFICLVVYAPIPFFSMVRDGLKTVLCYDVFGREVFGASSVFGDFFGVKIG